MSSSRKRKVPMQPKIVGPCIFKDKSADKDAFGANVTQKASDKEKQKKRKLEEKLTKNRKASKEHKIKQELNKSFEPNARLLRAQKSRIEKTLVQQNLVHLISSSWPRLSNGAVQTAYALEKAKLEAKKIQAREDYIEKVKNKKRARESRD